MAARTLQAFGTVRSVAPLMVALDGPDETPVPARNYGLVLGLGQRVLLQLFPAPTPPLVVQPLTAAPPPVAAGATLLNQSIRAIASAMFDVADVLAANAGGDIFIPSGWILSSVDPSIYALPDDGGIVVDFDAYDEGSAVQVAAGIYNIDPALTTDRYLVVHAVNLGIAASLEMPLFPTLDNNVYTGLGAGVTSPIPGLSAVVQSSLGYAIPLSGPAGFRIAVSDPTATASGTIGIVVSLYALKPSDVYTDPQLV